MRVDYEGECCVDCVMLIANGETPVDMDETETAAWLAQIARRLDKLGVMGHAHVGDDAGFSMSGCDYCGSGLGGDRYEFTIMS